MQSRLAGTGIEGKIGRAFIAAHLLTASAEQAENAVMEAIDSWDPDGGDEGLFVRVLCAALRRQTKALPSRFNSSGQSELSLPIELQAVLRLSPQLRRCYVLRILAGLSDQVSARLLHVNPRQVNKNTCAALKCLAGLQTDCFGGFKSSARAGYPPGRLVGSSLAPA